MASEKIIEFDENNRYKVKLEVGNVDTSTVKGVALGIRIVCKKRRDRT